MKTIKSIFVITILIILGLFTVSCSNSIKEDAHKKQRGSGTVSFNIQAPGQNKVKARMIAPSDGAVMKKLNSLSYDVELLFCEEGESYNTEVTKHYTSLEDFLSEASEMTLKYGDWKLSITGQEGQNGAEIVNAEEDFTVTDGDNLVTIKFKFSNELAGSLKYTFIVDGLTDLAATEYTFSFYSGNTSNEENRVDIDASTNAFYTNTWEDLADGIFGGVGCKLNSLEINNLTPGEYLLRITETFNGSDSGFSEQPVYIYGGIESTGCYTSLGNLLLLNYDRTNESDVHIYHKDLATAALPKIKKIRDGKADLTIADSDANKKLIVPYKAGNMFAGWYFDKDAYYTPGTNEPDLAPYSPVFEAKDEDGFIVKKDFELNAVWKQAIDVIPSEEVNNKIYVQTAKDDQSRSNGYITAKSLNELPDFLEPYNTSMGQVNSGYSEVSAFCDYVTNTTSDGDFIYFVENEYSDYNLKLRWHSLPAENLYTGSNDINGYWEDDINQKDLSAMFTDVEDFQEYDKKVFEKLYRQGNNLYIIGKCYKSNSNSDPYYFCLVKCELDETTHTPDIGSFEMFRKEIDDTIYKIQSFAVSDSNLVVAYKEDIDSTDVKIASYELNEFGNIVGEPVIKSLSDLYTITSSGSEYSSFQTTAEITEIYYYDGYFYTFVNECNVFSEGEADSGNTLVSTGKVLKLNSNLEESSNYSVVPEIKRLDAADGVYLNFKGASTPADMNYFMGPDRILGTTEDGSKLFIADDGLYMYKDSNEYKAKWDSRIVVFDIESGSIEYYIPVNLPYRGGQKLILNFVDHFSYEQ